jgi:hypothetical protein
LESLVELAVLLLHQRACILEFALQLTNLICLLLNELLHGLSKTVLQLELLFFELVFDLASACLMLLDALLHPLLSSSYFRPHSVDLIVLALDDLLKPRDFSFKLFDLCLETLNLSC